MNLAVHPPTSCPHAALQRATGVGRLRVGAHAGGARLKTLFQQGSAKIRFCARSGEAVLINTAGGLAEGDRLSWGATLDDGARQTITTQACEKVYRGARRERDGVEPGAPSRVDSRLEVGAGARLDWLPQETILFDHARLERQLEADLAEDGQLLAVEAVVLGRRAMGEVAARARLHDRWRVRRAGRTIFADDTRLYGTVAPTLEPALLDGAGAYASILLAAPGAEAWLDPVRALLPARAGASAWDGKLFCRILAQDGRALRRALVPVLTTLRDGAPLPRLWSI
ncbi:MAG TPA: urease accessory protein UreD [Caulobacteraceae bacterium]|nr:urease accessory protein UreD [Caulobacteraceae bacterium]